MLTISRNISLSEEEIELTAIRAQGAGGQNVNKVSSAIHLRFDTKASSLPEPLKEKLLALKDSRINKDGILIIKAQQYRTQEKNRQDALERLQAIISQANVVAKTRRATKPSKSAIKKRLTAKSQRSQLKAKRSKLKDY